MPGVWDGDWRIGHRVRFLTREVRIGVLKAWLAGADTGAIIGPGSESDRRQVNALGGIAQFW